MGWWLFRDCLNSPVSEICSDYNLHAPVIEMCSEYVMWLLSKAAVTGENKMWPSFLAEVYCTRLLLEL